MISIFFLYTGHKAFKTQKNEKNLLSRAPNFKFI